ncbi:MAG: flagellar hook-length control protein FliK [Ignavibacteriales bacterium]
MGIPIASLTDALLPVAMGTARAVGSGGPGAEFASLLRALLGVAGGGGEGGAPPGALPSMAEPTASDGQPCADAGDGTPANDTLAASLAGTDLALAQLSSPAVVLTPAGSPATEAGSTTTAIGTQAATPQPATEPSAAIESAPADTELVATPPTEADEPAPQPAVATPAPAEATAIPTEATAANAATQTAELAQALDARKATEPLATATAEAQQPDDGPASPGGPPATNQPASSVVRFVGNAEHQPKPGNQGGEEHRRDHQPNASIQGIAHASDRSAVANLRTDAPTDAGAPAPVDHSAHELPPAVHRVEQAVLERVEKGGGEAHIRLDPPELGSVHIHVSIHGDEVQVAVHADRHAAASLLRDHTQDLTNLLGQRGLNLTDVNVGLGGGDSAGDPRQQPGWARGQRGQQGEFAALMGHNQPIAPSAHHRLRAAYNPHGRHVYSA